MATRHSGGPIYAYTEHAHLVPFSGDVRIPELPTGPAGKIKSKTWKKELAAHVKYIADQQRILYARDSHAILLVFQGMDAAGKDSTIRKVLGPVNPAGCRVVSFKQPSKLELEHDFLWRTHADVPPRGTIGVFNRSHYEDVLIVKVHPELLSKHLLHGRTTRQDIWDKRYRAIRAHERHLADNGTIVLKFFLNVGRDEQKQRFLARIDDPAKNWKFNEGDVRERAHWDRYQSAYQDLLCETSRPWAPWYAIPADNKDYMRRTVAEILSQTFERLGLAWPDVTEQERARLQLIRQELMEPEA